MSSPFDLVIRNGLVYDGTGAPAAMADVAVQSGRIAAVGPGLGNGVDEIDASGRIVTPGFVDLHTHLDGHVTWESRLVPTTGHGITTCVTGNCGVGFAPVRPDDRDNVIRLMETVEDISHADLTAGLPWDWESFPDYLNALGRRRYNQDVAALIPHSTLRSYVMGERSLSEAANADDLGAITALVSDAVRAGAVGFGTSLLQDQKTSDGRHIPSYHADEAELSAMTNALRSGGGGVMQVAIEFNQFPLALDQLRMLARIGKASGQPIMFSLKQTNATPDGWRDLLALSDRANGEGIALFPQVLSRPTGAIMGLSTSMNPFSRCPSFEVLDALPFADKVTTMRTAEMRARLLAEAEQQQQRLPERLRGYRYVFPLNDPPNYEPDREDCIDAMAARNGVSPVELAYDLLLKDDGRQLLLLAGGNYAQYSLDPSYDMLCNRFSVPGLGDAGAHAGIICDASATTYMLSYWARDRARGAQLPLARVIQSLTSDCARAIGLRDRGVIAPGMKADLNVIDHDRLNLRAPRPVHDLPAGGTRLVQDALGYDATIVSGEIVMRNDRPTDALPGRLVRRQNAA